MHRGAEKLFEVRDYRQIIVLANRHDWLSAFSNELGVVLAVERMLGMEVPERAVWLRTLLAELNRVLNHLMFLGSYPIELGAITPIFYAFREREALQAVMEEASGGRMHYMFNRVGGLKEDVPAGWTGPRPRAPSRLVRRLPRRLDTLVRGNEIFRARTRGVGVLDRRLATSYGVSGPVARASGSTSTCAATSPTSPTASWRRAACRRPGTAGRLPRPVRVPARPGLRVARPRRALPRPAGPLPVGPINVRLPKVVKAPEGAHLRLDREPARHQRLLPGLAAARRRRGG